MPDVKGEAVSHRAHEPCTDGLWHVVLTRFSYRNPTQSFEARRKAADQSVRKIDPLDPARLERRARLFEMTCVPSLLTQTSQNFDWIIIIDKCLPQSHRQRLIDQVGFRPRTHLHEFSPSEDLACIDWLRRYASPSARRLLTTILDDDDALPSGFVAAAQTYITERSSLPPIMTLGAKSCVQWEAISSSKAPLGYRSSWHRSNHVMSAGFSLLCDYPNVALIVFSIDHILGDIWHKDGKEPAFLSRELQEFRTQTAPFFARSRAWSESQGVDLFVDVSPMAGAVVMTNHFFNDEAWRLLEHKPDRHRVIGNESFPQVGLRLESFTKHAQLFSKQWDIYTELLRQVIAVSKLRLGQSKFFVALWTTWRFVLL